MAIKHKIRSKSGKIRSASLTPVGAIRAFCLECVGWQAQEVRECTDELCPLFPFRMGRNPSRQGIKRKKAS